MASSDVDTWSEDELIEYIHMKEISNTDVQSLDELRQLVKYHMENSNQRHDNENRDATGAFLGSQTEMASSDVDTWSEDNFIEYIHMKEISNTDVKSLDELRQLVKYHMENSNQRHDNENRDATERIVPASEAERIPMGDILAKDQAKRLDLIQLYTEIQQFDHKFAESLNLQKQYPDRIKRIDDYICDLQKQTCPIVVAGEVGSGKSSFINMLLGEELMPSSQQPCTSAICKLQNSDRRAMKVTFDDNKTESHNLPDVKTLQDRMRKYARHNRTSEQRKCTKIDVYWQIPLLPKNVVLVDVPGIGESREMDTQVLNYISKALVCIYIVFSSNAGGVQKDKLKLILKHRIQSFAGVSNPFEHTLFLCNHWDDVCKSGDEDFVWNDTLSQLKPFIGDLNDNVMKISVKEVSRNLRLGLVQSKYVEDWKKMRQRFNRLLKDSLTAKSSHHYSKMASMLNETEKYLAGRRCFAFIPEDEKTQLLATFENEFEVTHTDAEKAIQKILTLMEQKFKDIAKELHAFIHSKKTKEQLFNTKENYKTNLYEQATQAVEGLIQKWEEKNQRIAGLKKEVEQQAKESIDQMLSRIQDTELTLENKYQDACRQEENKLRKITLSTSAMAGIGTSLLILPIALVSPVLCLIGIGIVLPALLFVQRKYIDEFKEWVKSKFQPTLRSYLKFILKSMTAEKLSDVIMHAYYMPMQQWVELSFSEHVLKTLHAKNIELEIVKEETRSKDELLLAIREANQPFSQIVGRFKLLQLVYSPDDYISDDNVKTGSCIGSGQFSDVYKATMKLSDRSKEVAVKVFKRQIQPETVNKQMSEIEQIRVLQHDNIVGYFGVRVYPGEGGTEGSDFSIEWRGEGIGDKSYQHSWMNVFGKKLAICLELCDESLEENAFRTFRIQDRLGKNEEGSLSTGGRQSALAHYKRITHGVTSGLAYIHDKGYMHRDLKLSNVLIRDGVAKITDFGMSQACDLSHNTMAGTISHMSPEMLELKEYSKPTDVYSMAILMWEFWYGQRSFTEQSQRMNVIELTKAIIKGLRPQMPADVQMPSQLHELVVACWQADPDKRPTATKLLERLRICNINSEQV